MKNILLTFLCCCFLFHGTAAQVGAVSNNTFTVIQNQPLSVSYESIDELLSDKLIPNAFSIHLNATTSLCRIYCTVLCSGVPNETLARQIGLKPSVTSGRNSEEIRLSLAPKLLLEQQPGSDAVISYDAIIHRQTTGLPTGNYDFSIQFTLTQP